MVNTTIFKVKKTETFNAVCFTSGSKEFVEKFMQIPIEEMNGKFFFRVYDTTNSGEIFWNGIEVEDGDFFVKDNNGVVQFLKSEDFHSKYEILDIDD